MHNHTVHRRHFHSFDALRFLAFFKVFLLHLPIAAFPIFNYVKAGGGIGVQFFFVLSGFLITYIILEEKISAGQFNLKHFFARRILRIWPLYYLMLLVAFATPYILRSLLHMYSSADGYQPDWWMSALFLENYKMMTTGSHPNVSPLGVMWSLCIEEHFYITWGLLLYFFRVKQLPVIITVCIITGFVSRYIYAMQGIDALDILTNIDLFAYGAIPAYLLATRQEALEQKVLAFRPVHKQLFAVFVLAAVIISSSFTKDTHVFVWLTGMLGGMFALLILFTIPARGFRISDNNILSRLGIYTYGLYMYHTLVISLMAKLFPKTGFDVDTIPGAVLFVCLALGITLVISIVSYHIFEKQFLKMKKWFR